MGHTPGPWTVEYGMSGDFDDDGVLINSNEGPVAFNVIDCSAHLIAAAPELLAALKQLVQEASDIGWDCSHVTPVIAKAEGRGE